MVKYNLYVYALLITLIVVLYKKNTDLKEGLNSCIENVQTECGPVTSYAIMLEKENSKLNKKIRRCISPQGN